MPPKGVKPVDWNEKRLERLIPELKTGSSDADIADRLNEDQLFKERPCSVEGVKEKRLQWQRGELKAKSKNFEWTTAHAKKVLEVWGKDKKKKHTAIARGLLATELFRSLGDGATEERIKSRVKVTIQQHEDQVKIEADRAQRIGRIANIWGERHHELLDNLRRDHPTASNAQIAALLAASPLCEGENVDLNTFKALADEGIVQTWIGDDGAPWRRCYSCNVLQPELDFKEVNLTRRLRGPGTTCKGCVKKKDRRAVPDEQLLQHPKLAELYSSTPRDRLGQGAFWPWGVPITKKEATENQNTEGITAAKKPEKGKNAKQAAPGTEKDFWLCRPCFEGKDVNMVETLSPWPSQTVAQTKRIRRHLMETHRIDVYTTTPASEKGVEITGVSDEADATNSATTSDAETTTSLILLIFEAASTADPLCTKLASILDRYFKGKSSTPQGGTNMSLAKHLTTTDVVSLMDDEQVQGPAIQAVQLEVMGCGEDFSDFDGYSTDDLVVPSLIAFSENVARFRRDKEQADLAAMSNVDTDPQKTLLTIVRERGKGTMFHWYVITADPTALKITIYDSLEDSPLNQIRHNSLNKALNLAFGNDLNKRWAVKYGKSVRQINKADSGVHAVFNFRALFLGQPLPDRMECGELRLLLANLLDEYLAGRKMQAGLQNLNFGEGNSG